MFATLFSLIQSSHGLDKPAFYVELLYLIIWWYFLYFVLKNNKSVRLTKMYCWLRIACNGGTELVQFPCWSLKEHTDFRCRLLKLAHLSWGKKEIISYANFQGFGSVLGPYSFTPEQYSEYGSGYKKLKQTTQSKKIR